MSCDSLFLQIDNPYLGVSINSYMLSFPPLFGMITSSKRCGKILLHSIVSLHPPRLKWRVRTPREPNLRKSRSPLFWGPGGKWCGGVSWVVGNFKLIPRILLFGDKNETYIDTKENRKIDIKYCMPTVMTRSCENERMGDYNAGVTHLQHRI